jgi:DNA transformation protein
MSDFIEFLHEVFSDFRVINTRRMFGLVADGSLYLKADKSSKQQFIDKNLTPFEYDKKDKKVQLSYYLAPKKL